jgi:drug/metabolite transporter (DMT)-like permease
MNETPLKSTADRLPRSRLLAAALIVALALAWGCNWPSMKIVLSGIDPWIFRLMTGCVGGAVFMIALRLRGISLAVPRAQWPALAVVALFNLIVFPTSSIVSLQYLPAGWAALIAYTMPIWAALLGGFVFRERITWRRVLALLLGLGGLVVLVGPGFDVSRDMAVGFAVILTGAVLWAVGVVIQKYVAWTSPVAVLTAWQVLLGGLPFIVLSAVLSDFGRLVDIPLESALALGYSIFIGLVAGTYLFYRVIELFPVTVAGIASLAVPVVGVLSSALLLGEVIGIAELAAMGLVVSAIALVLFEPSR